ncbi:MAG TPA: hypothetical protein ENJ41_05030 [Oceanospirillales bacterium]|nr:hypothetical protein [Oceanospirillales bacterium]
MLNQKSSILYLLLIFPFISFSQEMWINEFHYDNAGADAGEFVEVVVEDTFAGALADIEVVFYNGNNSNVYDSGNIKTLDTFTVGQSQGGFTIYSRLTPGMQNGAPDGLALVNAGTVVQFLSYEGSITAAGGPAVGMTSTDVGVFEAGSTQIGESLQLSGTGSHPGDFIWQIPAAATMGLVNNGQLLVDESPTVLAVFPADTSVAVASSVVIDIQFSETVDVTVNAFVIDCGGSNQTFTLDVGSDPSNYVLTGTQPWPASALCQVTLIASEITDIGAFSNQLDGNGDGTGGDDFVFSFTVASDDLAQVTTTTPADNAVLVAQNFTLDLNFSENVDLSLNAVDINCAGNVAIASGLPASNVNMVTITPASSVAEGTVCTVTLLANEITDLDGDHDFLDGDADGIAGGDFVFTFTIIEAVSEIFTVQGNGLASPVENSFFRFQNNVVTAVSASGFFMQTPDARDDGDIDTSNGIFVFTGSGGSVSVGDLVDLRGQVVEFFDFTELSSVSNIVVTANNQPMPTIIEFDANTPSQDPLLPSCAIEFECYEGMLIHVANGIANTGSQAFNGDPDAEAVVSAVGVRSMREPGVELSRINEPGLFDDPNYNPDIFDENPELFELDVDALGLPAMEINGGATFSATGVLAYQFNDYELWPKQLSMTAREFTPIRPQFTSEITIATQNMFRFFDDVDDPNIDDFQEDTTTTQTFNDRSAQAALYFRTVMKAPDIIVLVEIENLVAVQAIADKINADDANLNYSAHLVEGNDFGGIDIGLLTKQTVGNITVTQLGANEVLQFGGTNRKLHDRPPLWINATVTVGSLVQQVNVLGVHMRSRSGITGSDRDRIRHKHLEQALSVGQMVQDIQTAAPNIPLIVIGDFNDFEFSDGYADVVGETKGVIVAEKNLLHSDGVTIINPVNPPLSNVVDSMATEEKYSFIFRGIIQALDHALLNDAAVALLSESKYIRGNTDAPRKFNGDFSQVLAMSDHDGLMINLELISAGDLIFRHGFE